MGETAEGVGAGARRGRGRRGGGGAAARRAARQGGGVVQLRHITRRIPTYEPLDEDGLALIEDNAETILQEIGIEFRGDPEALAIWKDAGAGEAAAPRRAGPRARAAASPSCATSPAASRPMSRSTRTAWR